MHVFVRLKLIISLSVCEKKILLRITYQNSLQDIFDIFIGREGQGGGEPRALTGANRNSTQDPTAVLHAV